MRPSKPPRPPRSPISPPTAGDTQVSLTWTASSSSDVSFYSVYRSTMPGGPYTLVASNLATPGYTNTALQNGTVYYYIVTATDWTGYESVQSSHPQSRL